MLWGNMRSGPTNMFIKKLNKFFFLFFDLLVEIMQFFSIVCFVVPSMYFLIVTEDKRIHTADYADLSLLKHDDRINNTVWSSSQFNTMPQYSRHRIDSVQLKHREKRSASIVSSSPLPLSSPAPAIPAPTTETAYSVNVTCLETNNYDNTVPCYQQNETCVGAPEYCNYTREEYIKMLYDYIFPTTGEWILIGCHGIVFIVGLVST